MVEFYVGRESGRMVEVSGVESAGVQGCRA